MVTPTCSKCFWYCLEHGTDCEHPVNIYDRSMSFCGLHGREHIDNPNTRPPALAHQRNRSGYECECGFYPANQQLTLF